MQKFITLFLSAGLVFGAMNTAKAADIKASGILTERVSFANRNFAKGNSEDILMAATRLRTQIDILASESLKGVVFFEIGYQNWGNAATGASIGTDGNIIKVRYSYVDWAIPNTDIKTRIGLQLYEIPNFTDLGPAIIFADAPGITLSNQFTENVGMSFFWMRAANDNDPDRTIQNSHNEMDMLGLLLPMTFEGVKVTPWAIGGIAGRDSLKGGNWDINYPLKYGLLPLGGDANLVAGSEDKRGSLWWAGLSAELKTFDPFRLGFDAAYGNVDLGTTELNGHAFDLKRSGWYTALLAEYKFDSCTPGLLFWYASGDDENPYNGSERLPTIDPDIYATSYGMDGSYYGGAIQTIGYSISGTWAILARIKDISFIDNLTHTIRAVYYQGTNNSEMVRQGMIKDPQASVTNMSYFTTSDRAVELNFDTGYKMYENLSLYVEFGYMRFDMDNDLWRNVGYEAHKNNWKGTFSVGYSF